MPKPWLDLSHPFYVGMPNPKYFPPPQIRRILELGKDPMNVTEYTFAAHIGTHVDAPRHFIPDGKTIDELAIDRWIGEGLLLDLPRGRYEVVSAADLRSAGGDVRPGDFLLLRTGWGRHYGAPLYHEHPYLTADAAAWLLDRGVRALALDAVTPDEPIAVRPPDFDWPVHKLLLGHEVLIMENLRLEDAPAGRLLVVACPVNIRGSDGAPARIIAQR
ncbi:MAG: cyclase family protein [Chloroflexi bacterium]|nr:cyclase family protein [Chloroflexota bacterium]